MKNTIIEILSYSLIYYLVIFTITGLNNPLYWNGWSVLTYCTGIILIVLLALLKPNKKP